MVATTALRARNRANLLIGFTGLIALGLANVQSEFDGLPALALVLLIASMPRWPGDTMLARPARLLVALLLLYALLAGQFYIWPLHFFAPLCATVVAMALLGDSSYLRSIFRRGVLTAMVWLWVACIAVASGLALVAWVKLVKPDLYSIAGMIPAVSPIGLVGAALTFSILNALLEEVIWRGILLQWLAQVLRPGIAILIQALSFGIAHWNGVPSGLSGVVLATGYGILLGMLALRTDGLLAAVLAHVAADLVIFSLLYASLDHA